MKTRRNRAIKMIETILCITMLSFCFTGCRGETVDDPAKDPVPKDLTLSIDGEKIDVTWEENESVTAMKELVAEEPVVVEMSKYGGFEQVGPLGVDLPTQDEEATTEAGDIMLYSGDQIVVFYGSNTWDYTKLGHINGKTKEELAELLGKNNVTLTLGE